MLEEKPQPAAVKSSGLLVGTLCVIAAAFGWAAGFVVSTHGISICFSPAELAFHRFFWSGLLLTPLALRAGIIKLGGIGWGRGLALTMLAGPPQALVAYTGFILVPLGHGTTIQPACAALSGLILATLVLGERPTIHRIIGGGIIIMGLIVFGAESLATIGTHGIGGDLLRRRRLFLGVVRDVAAAVARARFASGAVVGVWRSLSSRRSIFCWPDSTTCCAWAWLKTCCKPWCREFWPALCRSSCSRAR